MQKYYKVEMDKLLRITTRVVWLVLALPPAAMAAHRYFALGRPGSAPPAAVIAAVTLLVAAIAYFTHALAPRGFALNDIELVIDRPMRPVTIPLSSVTEVRRLDDSELKGTLRAMGASGFYGHYGWFWNKRLGKFLLYSGRLKDLVLLRTHTGVFVLGPEDTESFAADLRALTRR
ncbi:MAG TPA: PH domain-containing protein [Elusimicrobiales bacterium]|nr:PH domain-containing protein [Elusimicrobiales bacterium]